MKNGILQKEILFFIILTTIAYLPYKRRTFLEISWFRAFLQSALFVVGSALLVLPNTDVIVFVYSPVTVGLFLLITAAWLGIPWYVRSFGKKPVEYIKEYPFRFVVRFEYRVMLMKYFEILFQQAQLLYVFFVLLSFISYGFYKLLLFFCFIVFTHFIHICLMPDRKAAIFWLKASVPMGVLFGPLLLSGHVLITTSIHILAYLFFVSYWFPNAKKWQLL